MNGYRIPRNTQFGAARSWLLAKLLTAGIFLLMVFMVLPFAYTSLAARLGLGPNPVITDPVGTFKQVSASLKELGKGLSRVRNGGLTSFGGLDAPQFATNTFSNGPNEFQRETARMKAEYDQRVEEMRAQFEQRHPMAFEFGDPGQSQNEQTAWVNFGGYKEP